MSTSNNPYVEAQLEQYRQILEGAAQPVAPEVDPLVVQRNQVLAKQYADRQAEIIRNRDTARAQAEAQERERRKKLDAEQRQRAEAFEQEMEAQYLSEFLARDGKQEDWPAYWKARKFDVFDELTKAHETELRRKGPAYGAF